MRAWVFQDCALPSDLPRVKEVMVERETDREIYVKDDFRKKYLKVTKTGHVAIGREEAMKSAGKLISDLDDFMNRVAGARHAVAKFLDDLANQQSAE